MTGEAADLLIEVIPDTYKKYALIEKRRNVLNLRPSRHP
jgi:hypothetical protein